MSIYKKHFVFAAALSILMPAAAAECMPDLANTSCNDQVKLAMNPARVLLAHSRIDDVEVTPHAVSRRQPTGILPESARLSQEGSTMRWLYSTVAKKRIFAMYTGPQRGRPAELRITVRFSLL